MVNKNEWTLLVLQENVSFYATRASSGSLATDRYFNLFPISANCQLQLSLTLVLEHDGHGALPLDSAKEVYHFFYLILFLVCWFIVPFDPSPPLICSQDTPGSIYFVYYFYRNKGRNTNQTYAPVIFNRQKELQKDWRGSEKKTQPLLSHIPDGVNISNWWYQKKTKYYFGNTTAVLFTTASLWHLHSTFPISTRNECK